MGVFEIVGRLLLWLGKFMFWSGRVAWSFFTPRVSTHPTVEAAAWARTVIGLGVAFATLIRYDALGSQAFNWAFNKPGISSLVATLPLLVTMAIAVARTTSGRDVLLRRLAKGPLLAVAVWNAVIWGFFLVLIRIPSGSGLFEIFYYLVALWVLVFGAVGTLQVYRNVFNAGDGHPLIPALVAPWFSAVATVLEVALVDGAPGDGVPKAIAVTLSVLGTLAVIALSWWEYRFITRVYGISLRDGAPATELDPETGRQRWAARQTPVAAG